jgi:type IV pilus biogenesis protein CpaD/CtpE
VLSRLLLCIATLSLASCDATDPYHREGVWRPNGANDANLRAMVVAPSDLVSGVSDTSGNGQQAAAAIDRYRNDKMRLLPDSGIAKIVPISGGTQQGSQ